MALPFVHMTQCYTLHPPSISLSHRGSLGPAWWRHKTRAPRPTRCSPRGRSAASGLGRTCFLNLLLDVSWRLLSRRVFPRLVAAVTARLRNPRCQGWWWRRCLKMDEGANFRAEGACFEHQKTIWGFKRADSGVWDYLSAVCRINHNTIPPSSGWSPNIWTDTV